MAKVERKTTYFAKPGPANTKDVIDAVADRVKEGGIKTVVVASTSGSTGVKFASAFKGKVKVLAVSHEKMDPKFKDRIVKLGGIAIDGTHLPLHKRNMDKMRNTLYILGQGFKVAVEVALIAVDKGILKPYEDVIAVAGTDRGSDTALVLRATSTKEIFDRDHSKRLAVKEVIAMPLDKRWWD